jgi:hypothetical protein
MQTNENTESKKRSKQNREGTKRHAQGQRQSLMKEAEMSNLKVTCRRQAHGIAYGDPRAAFNNHCAPITTIPPPLLLEDLPKT